MFKVCFSGVVGPMFCRYRNVIVDSSTEAFKEANGAVQYLWMDSSLESYVS